MLTKFLRIWVRRQQIMQVKNQQSPTGLCVKQQTIDAYLNTMGVKSTEEREADADLTDEDKKFLSQILQKTPEKIPGQLFED